MLDQRCRLWPNIKPELAAWLVMAKVKRLYVFAFHLSNRDFVSYADLHAFFLMIHLSVSWINISSLIYHNYHRPNSCYNLSYKIKNDYIKQKLNYFI